MKFLNKRCTRHTFWSCLIRCIDMKWIQLKLWAPQSGHGMRDGRTDRRTDGRTEWNQTTLLCGGYKYSHSITWYVHHRSGPPLFTKKTPSYGYRDPHYKPKTVWRPSQVYNGNPYSLFSDLRPWTKLHVVVQEGYIIILHYVNKAGPLQYTVDTTQT